MSTNDEQRKRKRFALRDPGNPRGLYWVDQELPHTVPSSAALVRVVRPGYSSHVGP